MTSKIGIGHSSICGSQVVDQYPVPGLARDCWATPYRGWHYASAPVIPSDLKIPGHEGFRSFDVPTVYQIPGQPGKWFMSFIGFNGQGYNRKVT